MTVKYLFIGFCLASTFLGFISLPHVSQAQQVYRITGTDGKISFSDQLPAVLNNAKVTSSSPASSTGAVLAELPYELRQIAKKYPVILYVGDNCEPCSAGRLMLTNRGIPFIEKTVNTNEDAQALERISGERALPLLTIGGQQLKGFLNEEWSQYLTAAAYPLSSVLPASYRHPARTPLAPVRAVALTAPTSALINLELPPVVNAVSPVQKSLNPSNIKF